MIVTRDEIIDACDSIAVKLENGLCSAFRWNADLPDYLMELGAPYPRRYRPEESYFWPRTTQGREQRLMFLAFMLTWHKDLENDRNRKTKKRSRATAR